MRRVGVDWWAVVRGVLVAAVVGLCGGSYVKDSILCDDIAAICAFNELPYDQNETVCGTKENFLTPSTCNCGALCVENMAEGDECDTTSLLSYPKRLCGPHLQCVADVSDFTAPAICTRNTEWPCLNEELHYEEDQEAGILGPGRTKPHCDNFGRYSPVQCSPGSTCYCVNQEGERLFGESPITDQENMDCRCSTYWDELDSKGFSEGLRCLPNGNFDSLHCLDGLCFCFNKDDNSITYGPFSFQAFTILPCYDPTLHNSQYFNPCHQDQQFWDSQGSDNMVIIAEKGRPVCTPDGYYAAVQYHGNTAYCTDILGNNIEEFSQSIQEANRMTCNCARRRQIMEENGLGASKPLCCPNGEYYPWQKRGLLAYCVDQNGNQYDESVAATDIQSLPCYNTQDPCEQPLQFSF